MNEEIKYLDSGLLEDFCLGLLPEKEAMEIVEAADKFPLVKQRIEAIEEGLKSALQVAPSAHIKSNIFQLLDDSAPDETIDLSNPPAIDKYSNVAEWNKKVGSFKPAHDLGDIKVYPLQQTASNELYVAWVYDSLTEDGHDEEQFIESFLILEGSCECNLGGKMVYLQTGDYLEIPFKIKHTISCTSKELGYVKAILQRRKVA